MKQFILGVFVNNQQSYIKSLQHLELYLSHPEYDLNAKPFSTYCDLSPFRIARAGHRGRSSYINGTLGSIWDMYYLLIYVAMRWQTRAWSSSRRQCMTSHLLCVYVPLRSWPYKIIIFERQDSIHTLGLWLSHTGHRPVLLIDWPFSQYATQNTSLAPWNLSISLSFGPSSVSYSLCLLRPYLNYSVDCTM